MLLDTLGVDNNFLYVLNTLSYKRIAIYIRKKSNKARKNILVDRVNLQERISSAIPCTVMRISPWSIFIFSFEYSVAILCL